MAAAPVVAGEAIDSLMAADGTHRSHNDEEDRPAPCRLGGSRRVVRRQRARTEPTAQHPSRRHPSQAVTLFPVAADWRDEVLYFLLVDRFSDGKEATRPLLDRVTPSRRAAQWPDGQPWRWDRWAQSGADRWQGGTLRGVASKLDYLERLGVTTIWIGPVFKQRGHLDTYPRLRHSGLPRRRSALRHAPRSGRAGRRGARAGASHHPRHHLQSLRLQLGLSRVARCEPGTRTLPRPLPVWLVARRARRARSAARSSGSEDGVWPAELQDLAATPAPATATSAPATSTIRTPSTSGPTSSPCATSR